MTASLAPDEKSTVVMIYTQDAFIRGELVTKQSVRVSILLRTDGAPRFFVLQNAQMVSFSGGTPRSYTYAETYIPVASVIGFHIAPPSQEPLDYDPEEKNRAVAEVIATVGTFNFKGNARFSAQSGFGSSLQMAHGWFSLYDVEITNPNLPQMSTMHIPMLLVQPLQVIFSL